MAEKNVLNEQKRFLVIIVAICAMYCLIHQVISFKVILGIMSSDYLEGVILFRMVAFGIVGIMLPIVVLATVLGEGYDMALGAWAVYFACFLFLQVTVILISGTISIRILMYVLYYLSAMILFLQVLKKRERLRSSFVGCMIMQGMVIGDTWSRGYWDGKYMIYQLAFAAMQLATLGLAMFRSYKPEPEKTLYPVASGTVPADTDRTFERTSIAAELAELKKLKAAGMLTDAEYNEKRRNVLTRL